MRDKSKKTQLRANLDTKGMTCVEQQHIESILQERTTALRERIKELNCLYALSRLAQEITLPLEEFLQAAVELLPPAWRYPEQAGARICLGSREFRAGSWSEAGPRMEEEITIYGQVAGLVEITYPSVGPEADPDLFLPEEHRLLKAVAEILSQAIAYRHSAEALQQSELKFRSFVEQSQDGIALTDEQGLVIVWNQAMEQITGLAAAHVLGRPMWDVQFELGFPEQQTAAWLAYLKAMIEDVLRTGQAPWLGQLLEREYLHPDGTRRFVQGVVFPIPTERGFMLGSISRDVTALKNAEKALVQQAQELARSNADLQQFIFMVSHQLQEPLRTVATHVQLLTQQLGDRLEPTARETMTTVANNAAQAQQLFDKLVGHLDAKQQAGVPYPLAERQIEKRECRVLLIEDNPGDVRLIREALAESALPIHLDVAYDGEEAIALLQSKAPPTTARRPALILLDLNLPRKNGYEVLQEIRSDASLRRIPVVVLSTSQSAQDIARSYDLGANCYIVKPFDLEHFFAVIRAIGNFWCGVTELSWE